MLSARSMLSMSVSSVTSRLCVVATDVAGRPNGEPSNGYHRPRRAVNSTFLRIRGSGSWLCSRVHHAREKPQNLRLKLAARLKQGGGKQEGSFAAPLNTARLRTTKFLNFTNGRGSGRPRNAR